MNEKDIDRILYGDTHLGEAIRQHEQKQPSLPAHLNGKVMVQLLSAGAHRRHLWFWVGGVAASLLIIIGIGMAMWPTSKPKLQAKITEATVKLPSVQQVEQPQTVIQAEEQHAPSLEEKKPAPMMAKAIPVKPIKKTQNREIPDTLGNEIWQNPENVERALRILADCEATILHEEQEMRNMVIEATFHGTPQPANAVIVTNEMGDYEVIETPNAIDI